MFKERLENIKGKLKSIPEKRKLSRFRREKPVEDILTTALDEVELRGRTKINDYLAEVSGAIKNSTSLVDRKRYESEANMFLYIQGLTGAETLNDAMNDLQAGTIDPKLVGAFITLGVITSPFDQIVGSGLVWSVFMGYPELENQLDVAILKDGKYT